MTSPFPFPRERLKTLWKLERTLGYRFKDRALLDQALTHPSYAHERQELGVGHYERLEFIGDAVLDLAVSDILFRANPGDGEGYLTRARADLVNKNKLAEVAANINLGEAMRLGKGEARANGVSKPSILSAALEAVIGAIYLDGGYNKAFKVIQRFFGDLIDDSEVGIRDPRSMLQEWAQKHRRKVPDYILLSATGPGHNRVFKVAVALDGEELAVGEGPSKKEAGKAAAKEALNLITGQAK